MRALLGLAAAACLAAGSCSPAVPSMTAEAGGVNLAAVVNGYTWSGLGGTTIADAASDPAHGLKVYRGSRGAIVRLSFSQPPSAVDLTEWRGPRAVGKRAVRHLAFALPRLPGTYTYEVNDLHLKSEACRKAVGLPRAAG